MSGNAFVWFPNAQDIFRIEDKMSSLYLSLIKSIWYKTMFNILKLVYKLDFYQVNHCWLSFVSCQCQEENIFQFIIIYSDTIHVIYDFNGLY